MSEWVGREQKSRAEQPSQPYHSAHPHHHTTTPPHHHNHFVLFFLFLSFTKNKEKRKLASLFKSTITHFKIRRTFIGPLLNSITTTTKSFQYLFLTMQPKTTLVFFFASSLVSHIFIYKLMRTIPKWEGNSFLEANIQD